ncbi:type 1 glutamine amidotransferase [Halomonas piscis]|uniref:type 1 glutamine amidotransferase n=1 Tax=Halomonas piscis TaxID=3031727 RepID=UPI0028987D56|nr:type 1 glutamine amidotransferase [Halomonas piscis]
MHVHLLQHSPHHGPARLADWFSSMGHSYTVFHLDEGELAPRPGDSDALIVLDGDEALLDQPPAWQREEQKLIERYLDGHKPLLGFGLGAHLIADALGATIAPGTFPEAGFHPVTLDERSPLDLPDRFHAFLWHRAVFSLPDNATPLGASEAAPLQGFAWDDKRVIGLLCQLHATPESASALLEHQAPPAGRDDFVQPTTEILADAEPFNRLAPLLDRVLSEWLSTAPAS